MAKDTKMAGEATGKLKSATATVRGERGIFRHLKEEHAQITVLMSRCAATDDAQLRRQLFAELRRQIITHSKGEEREFYPAFRQYEETEDLVDEAIEDHGAIEELIDLLSSRSVESEEWAELFDELLGEVEGHVYQEERELFPLCEKLLDDEEAKELEERYLRHREQLLRQVA